MTTAIVFSRQNDAGSHAHTALNSAVLASKGLYVR